MAFEGFHYFVDIDFRLVILGFQRSQIGGGFLKKPFQAFFLFRTEVQSLQFYNKVAQFVPDFSFRPLSSTTRSLNLSPTSPRSLVRTVFRAASENSDMFFCAAEP